MWRWLSSVTCDPMGVGRRPSGHISSLQKCKNEAIPPLHLCWDNGPCPPFLLDLCVLPHTHTHTSCTHSTFFAKRCRMRGLMLYTKTAGMICILWDAAVSQYDCTWGQNTVHTHAYDLMWGGWKLRCCLKMGQEKEERTEIKSVLVYTETPSSVLHAVTVNQHLQAATAFFFNLKPDQTPLMRSRHQRRQIYIYFFYFFDGKYNPALGKLLPNEARNVNESCLIRVDWIYFPVGRLFFLCLFGRKRFFFSQISHRHWWDRVCVFLTRVNLTEANMSKTSSTFSPYQSLRLLYRTWIYIPCWGKTRSVTQQNYCHCLREKATLHHKTFKKNPCGKL